MIQWILSFPMQEFTEKCRFFPGLCIRIRIGSGFNDFVIQNLNPNLKSIIFVCLQGPLSVAMAGIGKTILVTGGAG
jgi:hypothetical protein